MSGETAHDGDKVKYTHCPLCGDVMYEEDLNAHLKYWHLTEK